MESYDLPPGPRRGLPPSSAPSAWKRPRRINDPSLLLLTISGWLAVVAFGGLFWLVNGNFSVVGLEVGARAMGGGGVLFWDAVADARFVVPRVNVPPQPLIPWLGVVAASGIQVGIIWRLLRHGSVPGWVAAIGAILSVYDFATTFFGFGTLQWVQRGGFIVQVPLAVLITFGLETLIGYLLRKRG